LQTIRKLAALAVATAFLAIAPGAVMAQAYPSKPVRFVIGYPPGGPTDLMGRILAESLSKSLGQPFVVENKPGAAGNIAGAQVATAAPDGYTIHLVGLAIMTVNHVLYKNMTFDPATAFAPISLLVKLPIVLEVHKDIPVNTYQEFLAYARKAGTSLNHGSPGVGTLPHLAGDLFKTRMGFKSEHIAYRGTGPFAQGMTQGELQWSFDVTNTALTLSQNKTVKLLAVSSAKRWPAFPDVPTFTELGVSDMEWSVWFGIVAPAGTPKPIIDTLSQETAKAWAMPENAQRLRNAGLEPFATTPEETAKIFKEDRERWSKVVIDNNIKAE